MQNNDFLQNNAGGNTAPLQLDTAAGLTAGGIYLAKLGGYMFGLDTAAFDSLQRQTEIRWQAINRIGRAPAMQMTGMGEDKIDLSGVIYPYFRGGLSQIGLMRRSALAGEPLPLIYAFEKLGQYCGLWCIKSITEGRTEFMRDGTPRKISFQISLVAYGEDAGKNAIDPIDLYSGFVTSMNPPPLMDDLDDQINDVALEVEALPAVSPESELSDIRKVSKALLDSANAAKDAAANAKDKITTADGNPFLAEYQNVVKDLKGTADAISQARDSMVEVFAFFRDTPGEIADQATQLAKSLEGIGDDIKKFSSPLKSKSIELSKTPGAVEPAVAAAAITRAADQMLFATREGSRQSRKIARRASNQNG